MNVPNNSLSTSARAMPSSGIVVSRPRPTGATESEGITPNDIWRIIRRRSWVIFITSIILMAIGVGINIAWVVWWPSWPGAAILQVESPVIQEAMVTQAQTPPAELLEMFARSESNRIMSRRYANLVLQTEKVRQTAWFKEHEKTVLADFEEELSVSPIRQTPLIRVSFHTKSPTEAPMIVNTLTELYLYDRQKQAENEVEQRLIGLRTQEESLKMELDFQNAQINRFITDEKVPLAERQIEAETSLAGWTTELNRMQLLQSSILTAMENMEGQTVASWVPNATYSQRIESDPQVQNLRAYLMNLEEERETQAKRLGHDHMYIKRIEERIRIGERDMQNKRAELRQRLFGEYVGSLQQADASNRATYDQISENIGIIRDNQEKLATKIMTFRNMKLTQERLGKILETVKNTISDTMATLAKAKGRGTQVIELSPAIQSPTRSSPKLAMNLVATVFLSLMVSVGLAFLLEFKDKSVRSSQDIRRHIKLNMLGSIPDLEEDEANPTDMYSVVTHAPRSLLAEAFRQIRTNIMFSCSMKKCRSMLITSAAADDGRTSIAVNLAASIALSGKKVLLIDANFRRPALKRLFPNLPDVGFAQLVAGEASTEETIVQSDTPGLWVMNNGQTPDHHFGIMGGTELGAVIEQLSSQYDQVILDGPPALVSADALTLSGQVGAIVFVVRAGKNSRGELNRMRDEIGSLNAHIHGVVLNGIEAVGGGYLRKRYRQFYEYENEARLVEVVAEAKPDIQKEESQPEQSEKDVRVDELPEEEEFRLDEPPEQS